MKSTIVAALAAASISVLACEKAPTSSEVASGPSFITHGTVDGDAHPAVVLIIMDIDGTPAFRCSGTLIAPTFVLTAGHCAGEPGDFSGIRIFTESDVERRQHVPVRRGPEQRRGRRVGVAPRVYGGRLFPARRRHDSARIAGCAAGR